MPTYMPCIYLPSIESCSQLIVIPAKLNPRQYCRSGPVRDGRDVFRINNSRQCFLSLYEAQSPWHRIQEHSSGTTVFKMVSLL